MQGKERKILGGIAIVMTAVFLVGVLAAAGPLDLPGSWRTSLGFEDEYPPCEPGLYTETPDSPPRPAGRWRFEPPAPRAVVEGSAIAIGPIIYATNGQPGNFHRVFAYDTRTKKWSEPTQTPVGLNHSQPAVYKGDIYLAGGYVNGDPPTNRFWRYEVKEDRWTELPPMQQSRGAAATAVVGDKLYVAGGAPQVFEVEVKGEPYDVFEIYDFKTGKWETGPDFPEPRHHTVAVGLGGKLYVTGGRPGLFDLNNTIPPTDAFHRYDPKTGEWEELPPVPIGLAFHGMTTADGKIVVVGGEDQTLWEDGGGWVTRSAWVFNPKTERWSRLPDMTVDRRGFGAATAGGRIYALMGSYCPGLTPKGPEGNKTVESLPVSELSRYEKSSSAG